MVTSDPIQLLGLILAALLAGVALGGLAFSAIVGSAQATPLFEEGRPIR